MFSLYGDLPAPKSKNETGDTNESTNTSNNNATTSSTISKPATAGWSNMQQFRPMMRKPTIQAKPKLIKPVIPTGATIVSTTTVNKQDPVSSPPTTTATTATTTTTTTPPPTKASPILRPLQTKAYLSTKENVNGFRQNKKAKARAAAAAQNQGPPPIDLYEDYDPLKPTDYEQYKEEIEIIKRQERRNRYFDNNEEEDYEEEDYSSSSSSRSPSPPKRRFAPPPELYSRSPSPPPNNHNNHNNNNNANATYIQESGDDAYNRRVMMSQQQPQQQQQPQIKERPVAPESAAWKMMNKYGWQEGQGLGRDEDGIREALQVQARGDGSGVILPQQQQQQSTVIVLKNMVGQVDDQLEQETAEECEKYGVVEQCVLFPHQDTVWIFIKFAHTQAALNAIADLNGRYFDGRVVVAELFDQDRFDRLDLAH